jgi:CRP-like cAMP-binding protein
MLFKSPRLPALHQYPKRDYAPAMDVELLRSVSIFRKLTDDELRAVCDLLIARDVKPKERIIEEGTPVKNFSIVCEGVVHIRRLANKREMLLGRLGPGGFFGEINLFDPGVATASIYAMKPTRLANLDYESFHRYMEAHPATGYKIVSSMMTEMARRLRQTSARLVNTAYWANAEAALPHPPSAPPPAAP